VLAATYTCAHQGVDTYMVRVEARITQGLPQLVVVGLADTAVREGRERVRAAIKATLGDFPFARRIVVNLSPASLRKAGAAFDLAVAMALLGSAGSCDAARLADTVFLGELGLDGSLRPVPGALPAALAAVRAERRRLVVPAPSATEAAVVDGVSVYAASSLADALALERTGYRDPPLQIDVEALFRERQERGAADLADVRGQAAARRALEIAAAGNHHVLMTGPPGGGKTMLARRMPTLLPPLTVGEAIETTSIHSIAGLNAGGRIMTLRPFRAPHHTTSGAGMVGGGTMPRPGEVSLAHNGVLFLDELPEFAPTVLNQLREPLEDGYLTICRARARLRFPARVTLVAAMNPCPCGYRDTGVRECTCSEQAVRRYLARISGPLLDRIDLQVYVPRLDYDAWSARTASESSATVRERVVAARAIRARRALRTARAHGAAGADGIGTVCDDGRIQLARDADALLRRAVESWGLSARGVHRVTRVARTIAHLAGRDGISAADVAEALQYRGTQANSALS